MKAASNRKDQKLRVGLAQVDCIPGDVASNIAKFKKIIAKHRGKVDLLVFPEYALAGYVKGDATYSCAPRMDDERFLDLVDATEGITIGGRIHRRDGVLQFL